MIPYRISRNPNTASSSEFFNYPEKGANCELLVNAITRARGFEIPEGIRSSELYADTEYTQAVDEVFHVRDGDIIGFCSDNKIGFAHVGILCVDEEAIYVVHNTKHVGFAQRQRLEDIMKYSVRAKIAWIKRPIIDNPALLNPGLLRKLGFGYLVRKI